MIWKCIGSIHFMMVLFIIAYSSADREGTLKLGEYVSERVAVDNGTIVEGTVKRKTEVLLPADELAWIVMIFSVSAVYDENISIQLPVPSCFGILITGVDVLTACSCMEVLTGEMKDTSIYLIVKPKTSIVWWDDDYKSVTQTRPHYHCQRCSHKSYNNVALLTVDGVNTIYGVVETIPRALILPQKEEESMTRAEMFSDCFILGLATGYNTPRLGSLELEKHRFVVWDIPSPINDLGTVAIFGTSLSEHHASFGDTRFPGSPLICRLNDEYVPVGIHLGLFCSENITLNDLNTNCKKTCVDCEDCLPNKLDFKVLTILCRHSDAFEIVLRFKSLYDWIDDNTFEPVIPRTWKRFRPAQLSNTISPSLIVYISTALLRIVL